MFASNVIKYAGVLLNWDPPIPQRGLYSSGVNFQSPTQRPFVGGSIAEEPAQLAKGTAWQCLT